MTEPNALDPDGCKGILYLDHPCGKKLFAQGLCRGCFFRKLDNLETTLATHQKAVAETSSELTDFIAALKGVTGLTDEQVASLLADQ